MTVSRYWAAIPFLLVILISAAYLTISFSAMEGRAVAPLDDAYITFQYARQIARGHPYEYNVGDPPTTGMTSPLFGFLLAGAYLVGLTNESLVAFAVGLGVVWLALIGWLTHRLGHRLAVRNQLNQGWALTATVLVLLAGPVQWGCFNGMETGLFTALSLAALSAFLAERMGLAALCLGLAGLTRTEGLILSVLLCFLASVKGIFSDTSHPRRRLTWDVNRPLLVAVLIGLTPYLTNWALTGSLSAAGIRAKSWFLNVPFYPKEIARSILRSYQRIIVGRFSAGYRWFVPPGLILLSTLGWIALGIRRRWMRLSATLCWFLVGTLSTATLITAHWHMGRYQAPFIPVIIALATFGLAFLWQRTRRPWQRIGLCSLALYMLLASGYSSLHHLQQYRLSVLTMSRQQLPIADWLRENLAPGTRVGVHDTGSLRYVGQRPTYDVIGLTTQDAAIAWRHGAGSVFESMEHSPMRPSYFAIYPDAFSIPYLAATDLFAEKLLRVEVPDYAVASAGPVQGVWRADWHLAGSGEEMHQSDILERTRGLELVDALDVANLDDEAAHQVEWWQEVKRPGFPTEVWQMTYRVPPQQEVLDGGRLLTGGIAFDAHTEPGEELWIVVRLHAQQAGGVRVETDGQEAGYWAYPSVPGHWLETTFQVPGDQISRSRTRVTLRVDADNPTFQHYALYHVWLLQGDAKERAWTIERRSGVTFGESLSLLGFDPPNGPWRPGDVLPVALYWQAMTSTQSDAKVFLHLYDAAGNLVAQSDGWAFHGTRPPYTWPPGGIVEDPRMLSLPDTLAPGEYSLDVGLYHPDGSGRLRAYRDGVRQAEDRVVLTRIDVVE